MGKLYLGIDCSSTTIGLALIDSDNGLFELKDCRYYKPDKKCDLFESLSKTKKCIIELLEEWKPNEVVIEEIAEFFAPGKSTSKTIIKLATYNRMVGLTVYEALQKPPVMLNVNTARSVLRPKDYAGKLAKEDVPTVVAAILKTEFPWKLNKKGKPADENYDMADAIAVALAQAALDLGNVRKTKRSSKKSPTK
jgi:Holliday junction resolvasome RuvABC endonuclease subunit